MTYLVQDISEKDSRYLKLFDKFIINYSNLKDYLIDKLKNFQVSNFEELINSNSFKKSYFFKVIDSHRGEKLKYLIKIKKKTISESKFSIYIRKKLFDVSNELMIEDIKWYIENKILIKIFGNEVIPIKKE